jgi:hypothetical protein
MQLSLIDTDILSEFLKKKDPIVVQKAADYPGRLTGKLAAYPTI